MTTRGLKLAVVAGAALAVAGVLAGVRYHREVAREALTFDPKPLSLSPGSMLHRAHTFATSPTGTSNGAWRAALVSDVNLTAASTPLFTCKCPRCPRARVRHEMTPILSLSSRRPTGAMAPVHRIGQPFPAAEDGDCCSPTMACECEACPAERSR
jgi:hypothetical protein